MGTDKKEAKCNSIDSKNKFQEKMNTKGRLSRCTGIV